jgi:hypothetical protein
MTVMGQRGNSRNIKRSIESLKAGREEVGQEVNAGKSEHRTKSTTQIQLMNQLEA